MIQQAVDNWEANKALLELTLQQVHPENYKILVTWVLQTIKDDDELDFDWERMVEIDHGHYQGMLVFVIPETGYQPYQYWYLKIQYGSCSVCDTLEGIRNYNDNPPNLDQVKEYMTLALHIVQNLKEME